MDFTEQEELVHIISNMMEPIAYTMHFNFINFREFALPQPIYINMVRDPIERVISWFYYRRTPWHAAQMYRLTDKFRPPVWYKKDFEECVLKHDAECQFIPGTGFQNELIDPKQQMLFFCGHQKECE